MKKVAFLAAVALVGLSLVGIAGSSLAITAKPLARALLGTQAEPVYFKIRPHIVDLPESPARAKPIGTCKALVLLIDFPDKPADREADTPAFFETKLFGAQVGSLRSYFLENSYGKFALEGDVYGWLRSACRHSDIVNRDLVAGTKDDHGLDTSSEALVPSLCEYPLNIWGLVEQAVRLADSTVDFSAYDNDGPDGIPNSGDDDGFVDALFIVHSGIGAEAIAGNPQSGSENFIWSLESSLDYYAPTRGTTADGVRIGAFVIVPELSEIGVFAHEFCHLLGLPDLYNNLTGNSVVGNLCLMDGGAWLGPQGRAGSVPCHLSTFMKYILGWQEPQPVCLGCDGPDHLDGASIGPHSTTPSAYSLLDNPGGMDWTNDGRGQGEYFLIENRQPRYGHFDSYVEGHGLVIWKVDESRANNNDPKRRLADVIQADGGTMDPDLGQTQLPGDPSDFWPGSLERHAFTPYSVPSSNLSGNRFSGAAVENILEDQTGLVTADLRIGLSQRGKTYAYPNPYSLHETAPMRIVFLPTTGPAEPAAFEVTVFDIQGNPVRKLNRPGEVEPDGTALWDGRDDDGKAVKPGLYIYYAKSSGQEASGLVAIKE